MRAGEAIRVALHCCVSGRSRVQLPPPTRFPRIEGSSSVPLSGTGALNDQHRPSADQVRASDCSSIFRRSAPALVARQA